MNRIIRICLLCCLMALQLCACDLTRDARRRARMEEKGESEEIEAFRKGIGEQTAVKNLAGNKRIRIGSVNMGMTSEWFAEVMNGIWDASQDLQVSVEMLDSANDIELERKNIQQLVDKGIDALVISPRDSEESIACLKPAIDAGIPIITWNTSVNMDVDSFICVDSNALGGNTGDYLCEYIKTYGLKSVKLFVIDNKNYDVGIARCEGFKDSIKSMIDQNVISIVAEDDAETYDVSYKLTEETLKEHPEISVIWAWNQPSLLGAIEAVKRNDREDILILGTDMSMELAEDMLADDVNLLAVTTQMPYNMGYKAVVTAVKVVKGESVDKTVDIPLFTYKKTDRELVERYLQAHQGLSHWGGGNGNEQ